MSFRSRCSLSVVLTISTNIAAAVAVAEAEAVEVLVCNNLVFENDEFVDLSMRELKPALLICDDNRRPLPLPQLFVAFRQEEDLLAKTIIVLFAAT